MKHSQPLSHLSFLLLALSFISLISCFNGQFQGNKNTLIQNGDDILAMGAPPITETVAGDVILAGKNLNFTGTAGGDYLGAGGQQIINGRIHGSLRAAGGDIRVSSTVDRNATIAGGQVTIDTLGVIERNAYLAGGGVQVDGAINEALRAVGNVVVLNGRIRRDVEIYASVLRIGPSAEIGGNLRYRVPRNAVYIDPAAQISGTVTALPLPQPDRGWLVFKILWTFGFLVAGVAIVSLIPRFVAAAAALVQARPGISGLIGLIWNIVAPIFIIAAALTIIGAPLALLVLIACGLLLYFGRGILAVWLGRRLLGARAGAGRRGTVVSFLLGALILIILGFIPFLGPFIIAIATLFGIGAILRQIQLLLSSETSDTAPRGWEM